MNETIHYSVWSHRGDGTPRHASVFGVLRHFQYGHLPPHLQKVSVACAELAIKMADELPENADLTYGLRELLSAKDNFVRAQLPPTKDPDDGDANRQPQPRREA